MFCYRSVKSTGRSSQPFTLWMSWTTCRKVVLMVLQLSNVSVCVFKQFPVRKRVAFYTTYSYKTATTLSYRPKLFSIHKLIRFHWSYIVKYLNGIVVGMRELSRVRCRVHSTITVCCTMVLY